jgi:sRNA-binding regulator protein Hfq
MSDSSAIPVRRIDDARQTKAKPSNEVADLGGLPSISPAGPRKLIRPHLTTDPSRFVSRLPANAPTNRRWEATPDRSESSHAEAFYLQKQIQSRTLMIFLLEDGERIEGYIEWYDRNVIKVRQGSLRTLIYKNGIKYLYKAGEASQVNGRL